MASDPNLRAGATRHPFAAATAAELRQAIRRGEHTGPTAGLAVGYVQANLVVVPAADAADFAAFCRQNDRPCPLVGQSEPGEPRIPAVAAEADLRTDLPRYRVFRHGVPEPTEPTDIRHLWRDDFVAFLLGCSFTFENGLSAAGLPVRHIDEGRNVPMYRTNRVCAAAGKFSGNLVVSMRPFRPEHVELAHKITARFPRMHGAPVHVGDHAELGIEDLGRPDFGDAVTVHPGETPVFWACGVTPQLALAAARCELAITHSPGCMFVTDLRDSEFEETPPGGESRR
ncbi:MAG: putative hydro-lyase [Pirellulales bacterium]